MSVYTKSNKKSWAEKGKVKFPPHALRDWPRYISVVIKATFHVSVAFPIIFTLLLLQFKRIPPCMWYSGEENSNKHPLRGNRFKMSQSDSHPSCGWGLCHLYCKWIGEPCVCTCDCVWDSGCMNTLWTWRVWLGGYIRKMAAPDIPQKIKHGNN